MRAASKDMQPADSLSRRAEDRLARYLGAARPISALPLVLKGRYLVKGVLDRRAVSVIYGPPNVGKSFLALDLALHLSAGADRWFGHRLAKEAGPALYIAAEGDDGFAARVHAARAVHPDLVNRAMQAGMQVLPLAVSLCDEDEVEAVIAMVGEIMDRPPSLIVVDTLNKSLGPGRDENSGSDMAAFAAACRKLQRAIGAHVMVIHHSGKDASRGMRGHSSLLGDVDTAISIFQPDDGKGLTCMKMGKQRDDTTAASLWFGIERVVLGRDEDGDEVTSAVVVQAQPPQKDEVIEAWGPSRGALDLNTVKTQAAHGRAEAALRLLTDAFPDRRFNASDAAYVFSDAGLTKSDPATKPGRENARALLKRLVLDGNLTEATSGWFTVPKVAEADGGGK
ncbi:AAA family ATPase [Rhodobacter sp. SGA-6-6]|uniref:AAA family ATPase n=1 Tax=Rhodobacter sp. SGA-6-6 TaxID=2710882 RepID=UPI0013EB9ADF|nr:AAA family ATPase [Rhodobacter sp. SGA-6-6]NGM45163.1 AAA family ATPase [Rhodobacter sp. SGA-6-6]